MCIRDRPNICQYLKPILLTTLFLINNINNPAIVLITVSYTHLDVYKRQVRYMLAQYKLIYICFAICCVIHFSAPKKCGAMQIKNKCKFVHNLKINLHLLYILALQDVGLYKLN